MPGDRDKRVSARAYELWEQEGGEHGRHEDHWHRAASEIDEQVAIAAPDGTTLTMPADEMEDAPSAEQAAKPTRGRTPAKAKAEGAASPAAKSPSAKPRKPKAK